jgi:hypothetical protein
LSADGNLCHGLPLFFQPVLSLETFHPSGRVDQFLLAGEKGVTPRTDFHGDFLLDGFRPDFASARAFNYRFDKLGMYPFFHFKPPGKVAHSVIPAKAGIQNRLNFLDSGSRFACPE